MIALNTMTTNKEHLDELPEVIEIDSDIFTNDFDDFQDEVIEEEEVESDGEEPELRYEK